MKIKYVEIENILSIQKIRLDFDEVGLILLDGWNYDDDTANAAGKTAILNSIAYGIYGKFPRKISAADILRFGTKSGYVKVGVEVNGTLYEIYRARPNNLKFWIDGLEKDLTQTEFESYIKLSYSQYLISQYSAQTEGMRLISLNDTGKKDFFLQLMNLDYFDDCKKSIEVKLKELVFKKNKNILDVSNLSSRIGAYSESIADLSDIQLKLEELDPGPIKEQLIELQKLEKPDTSSIDLLEEKLNSRLIELKVAKSNIESNISTINILNKKIARLSQPIDMSSTLNCPHCNGDFIIGAEGSLTVDHIISERKNELDILTSERDALADIGKAYDLDNEIEKINITLVKCRKKKLSDMEEYNESVKEISNLKSSISRREAQILSLKEAIEKNNTIIEKIEQSNKQIVLLEQQTLILDKDIELHETVCSIFSSTGAPAYILDSAVDVFNEKVSAYISMIWPNASYLLQSFKENKSGDVKAKFSEKLTINGKERSIGALSGGEHRCLSLGVDFAIIDVMEAMFGITINPVMLDEPFNDLDASNRERVLNLLDKVSIIRQVIVIDHASEAKAMFSNIIRVEKRSGVSNLA